MRDASVMFPSYLTLCLLGLVAILSSGCAASRSVRPIGEGHLAAGASLGGPIFNNLAVPVTAPLVTVFGRYGVTQRTDVDMGLMLPVGRVVGADVGASHLVLRGRGAAPHVMLGARLAVLGNARSWVQRDDVTTHSRLGFGTQLFEEAYVNTSWDVTRAAYGFLGADVFAQVQHNTWRPSLMAGFVWHNQAALRLQVQLSWLALHKTSDNLSVRYVSVGGLGAIGVQFGLTYDFGRLTQRTQ